MTVFEKSYCAAIPKLDAKHKLYHDKEYGFPITDDQELYARLMLEVNQAGLSWNVILQKREGMVACYDGFDINTVANYTVKDRERLLQDPRIIRNKLKVNAAIVNAQRILVLQEEYGSFYNWLVEHFPLEKMEWIKLFKKNFKFTGGEITNEFLMSIGFLPGAHHSDCPIFKVVAGHQPMWMNK